MRGDEQRRSKQQRDTGTRDDLLEAARRCVRDNGLGAVRSRDIAAAAGANLAAITYHFGSKDDLVATALFDELRTRLDPALEQLVVPGDPAAAMLGAVERLVADFERNRRDAPLYLEALVAATRTGAYATSARKLLRRVRTLVRDHLAALRDAGAVPAWVEPDAMSSLILAVANGVALQVSIDPRGPTHGEIARQFAGLLLAAGGAASRPADGGR